MRRRLLLPVVLFAAPGAAQATTVEVCDPNENGDCVQSIEVALEEGATEILVHPNTGSYPTWPGPGSNGIQQSVTIKAADDSAPLPIISDNGALVTFDIGEDVQGVVIEDLEIRRGSFRAVRAWAGSELELRGVRVADDSDSVEVHGFAVAVFGDEENWSQLRVVDSTFENLHNGEDDHHGIIATIWADLTIEGSTFSDNSVEGVGGGLAAFNSEVLIQSSSFGGHEAKRGGAIYVQGTDIEVADSSFSTDKATLGGGAVTLLSSEASIESSTFDLHEANWGGAVYAQNSQTKVNGSDFVNNWADGSGGAIYVTGGAFDIESSFFDENEASWGGAVFVTDGDLFVDGASFIKNLAERHGGAVRILDTELAVLDSSFSNNVADEEGGAIAIDNSGADPTLIAISGTDLAFNDAEEGGAIFIRDASLDIYVSELEDNEADEDGGAVYVTGAETVTIEDTTLRDNPAGQDGGALYIQETTGLVQIEGTAFIDNQASRSGGGFRVRGEDNQLDVLGSIFEGNIAGWAHGGAVRVQGLGGLDVIESQFVQNQAGQYGGAVAVTSSEDTSFKRSLFCSNEADDRGGAVYATGDDFTFLNNVVTGNEAGEWGGGVGTRNVPKVQVVGNAFLKNEAPEGQGGGLHLHATGWTDIDGVVSNNLVAWTTTARGFRVRLGLGSYVATDGYNAYYDNEDGHIRGFTLDSSSIVDQNPRLVDFDPDNISCAPDTPLWGIRPHWGSPLIDAGNTDYPNPPVDTNNPGGNGYVHPVADIGPHGGPYADLDWWVDNDDDGWPYVYDCVDSDPDIFPDQDWWADCDGDTHFGTATVQSCGAPVLDAYNWTGDWPEACADKPPLGDWTNEQPDPFDCDDADPTVWEMDTWWADCDGDGYYGMDTVESCGEPDLEQINWSGDWPEACDEEDPVGGWTDQEPEEFDCFDDDPDVWQEGNWWADCDGDGFFGGTTLESCGVPDPNDFGPDEWPCDDNDSPEWTPDEPDFFDCDDEDPDQPAKWWADCDGDGFFGGAYVHACEPPTPNGDYAGDWPPACDGDPPEGGWTDQEPEIFDCDDTTPNSEGAPTWWADCDGDGYFGTYTVRACGEPDLADPDATFDPWPPACGGDDPDGGWTDQEPEIFDCDDATPDPDGPPNWWADCDGDDYPGDHSVRACESPTLDDGGNFYGTWPPACDGEEPSKWTDIEPPVFDCDDTNPDLYPSQTWWADCDGDGYLGEDVVTSCDEPGLQDAGADWPCRDDQDDPVASQGDWTHQDPGPDYVFDCDDNDPDLYPSQTWWADCDGDGVLGETSLTSCAEPDHEDPDPGFELSEWPCEDAGGALIDSQGGWTHEDPGPDYAFDCNDNDPHAQVYETWWADCDGDGYYGTATVQACGTPTYDETEYWSGDWPAACGNDAPKGGWTRDEPDVFDCDDTDPDLYPDQKWWADCDGDGVLGETVLVACDEPDHLDPEPSIDLDDWPCQDAQGFPIESEGGWTHEDPGPGYVFDCNDNDPEHWLVTTWYADCDGDGVFGEHTLDSCGPPEPAETNWEGAWPSDCHDAEGDPRPPLPGPDANHWTDDLEAFDAPRDPDTGEYIFDCDDGNPNVYPGNTTFLCDGKDNNCDGALDEGDVHQWYPDEDGDGFGDADAEPIESCEDLSDQGFVLNDEDCDDTDPDIHPETIWCKDADGDGYGDPEDCLEDPQCEPPEVGNWAPNDLDCDDTDPDINPETIWYEDRDGDGYGDPDTEVGPQCEPPPQGDWVTNDLDCAPEDPTLPTMWFEDVDGDGYGDPDSYVIDCDPPPGYVDNDLDCAPGDPDLPKLWYKDHNGDGYGDPDDYVLDCDQPDGYVDTPLDCDLPEVDHPDCKEGDAVAESPLFRFTGGGGLSCNTAPTAPWTVIFGALTLLGLRGRRTDQGGSSATLIR